MEAAEKKHVDTPNLKATIQTPEFHLRSSLFSVRNRSQKRKQYTSENIIAADHYNIKLTGEQLDQHDMAVLFSTLLAKDNNQSYRQELVVSLQQILRGLNTTDGSSQRRAINNSFQRFTEVTFDIVFGHEQFSTTQLAALDYCAKTKAYTLSFSEEYAKLCAIDTLTTLNIKERNSLPQGLTSWFYGYWSTFEQLPPLQIDELYKLCGSASSNMSTFKRSLTMALSTLENIGFIQPNWNISKPGFIFASKTSAIPSTTSTPKTEEEIIA